jgi:hypothetical protein
LIIYKLNLSKVIPKREKPKSITQQVFH